VNWLLCRNHVRHVDHWRDVFESHAPVHREAGLVLRHLWADLDKSNQFMFLFEVTDLEKARAYLENPRSIEAGELAGVLDGDWWFLEDAPARRPEPEDG